MTGLKIDPEGIELTREIASKLEEYSKTRTKQQVSDMLTLLSLDVELIEEERGISRKDGSLNPHYFGTIEDTQKHDKDKLERWMGILEKNLYWHSEEAKNCETYLRNIYKVLGLHKYNPELNKDKE